jgi:hypothetical protein
MFSYNISLPFPFWRKKIAQKTGRKLTRTVGLWVLRFLGKGSRTIPVYDFGYDRPAERCSNMNRSVAELGDSMEPNFRRWMCGCATGF